MLVARTIGNPKSNISYASCSIIVFIALLYSSSKFIDSVSNLWLTIAGSPDPESGKYVALTVIVTIVIIILFLMKVISCRFIASSIDNIKKEKHEMRKQLNKNTTNTTNYPLFNIPPVSMNTF